MWTNIDTMSDELLIEELLVALALDVDASPLTREVIRRGLVADAIERAREKTTEERRRLS